MLISTFIPDLDKCQYELKMVNSSLAEQVQQEK